MEGGWQGASSYSTNQWLDVAEAYIALQR